jgi:hypothetical protein
LDRKKDVVVHEPRGARRTGTVRALVDREVQDKVFWCPTWVPLSRIVEALANIGAVMDCDRDLAKFGNDIRVW